MVDFCKCIFECYDLHKIKGSSPYRVGKNESF
jgi:hypothetical protein